MEIEVDSNTITTLNITANSDQLRTIKYDITAVLLPGKNVIKERGMSCILTKDISFLLKTKKKANIKIKKLF